MNLPAVARLPTLGVIRIAGPDARRFLQGQLSNDLEQLAPGRPLRAGLHTPQGRVIAILLLLAAGEDVLLVLPQELVARVAAHLGRYVLRAKLRIEDISAQYAVYGASTGAEPSVEVRPADAAAPEGRTATAESWQESCIAAGLPQVYAATSEQFVAQMLNLDRVGGISFTKGCYAGQEIIARAHYRGRVKRRMQRFTTRQAPVPLVPGARVQLAGGPAVDIVDARRGADGSQHFLAVAPLPGTAGLAADEDAALPVVQATTLPLPYALEDAPA